MKICPSCGWSNAEIKYRCSKCGTVLPEAQNKQEDSAPKKQESTQQPKEQIFIQARSQNCIDKIEQLDKLVSKIGSIVIWGALFIAFIVLGLPRYIEALIEDIPLRYVEQASTGESIWALIIIVAGCVGSKKLTDYLNGNISPYRGYCAVETLIVDNYKIYGATTKGNIQLSYENINGVRCRPSEYDGNRFRLDNDILEIQDTGGKIHTFYTFSNSRELQTIIQMNLQNRG